MKSFLQTKEWLEFQKSIGRKIWRFDNGKITANIIKHDLPWPGRLFGKNYLYIPHGPVVDFSNAQSAKPEAVEKFTTGHGPVIDFNAISGGINNEISQFVAYLKNLAREEKSIFVKMEPLDDKVPELFYKFGFKKSSKEIQPKRTVIIDLEKSEDELLAAMHHKTRYNIRVGEKRGLQLREKNDPDAFWKLLKHTAKNNNFFTHDKNYYNKLLNAPALNARTVFVEHDDRPLGTIKDRPIAGAILLTHGDTLYYLHGAMDRNYKSMMAPYTLHWQIIKWAKKQGLKHYDLWGINAAKWPGVTRFKLGWGGREVEYPGAFDLPISRFWHFIYNIFQKIR